MALEQLVQRITKALHDKQALALTAYDMRGRSDITDAHILATGSSAPHLKALMNAVHLTLKDTLYPSCRTAGTPESGWVVVDCVDVVVHLFSTQARSYYALDELWQNQLRFAVPTSAS